MDEIKGFTAGPWIADGPPDNIHILVEAAPHLRVCFLTSNGPTEANARLIAAAPTMYAEITRLRRVNAGLVELLKLFERSIDYEIRKSRGNGDDEGVRMKTFTLNQVRAALRFATEKDEPT